MLKKLDVSEDPVHLREFYFGISQLSLFAPIQDKISSQTQIFLQSW